MHNGGRAIDVDVNTLKAAYGKEYLDAFWPVAARHGFTPVITRPEEGKSESWHYDHFSCWTAVRDRLGYEHAGMCAAVVVGQAGEWQGDDRVLQALLLRAGFDIGEADGAWGARSEKALKLAIGGSRKDNFAAISAALRALPYSANWTLIR